MEFFDRPTDGVVVAQTGQLAADTLELRLCSLGQFGQDPHASDLREAGPPARVPESTSHKARPLVSGVSIIQPPRGD
jgi:hypothetical protein